MCNNINHIPEVISKIVRAMAAVEKKYYILPRAGVSPAKRERIYCYELYHQMRLIEFKNFTIHGEPDKRGNKDFDSSNPDFIIHKPGTDNYEHNLATIEVKVDAKKVGIREDINQLKYMIEEHSYNYGIFILVGKDIAWFCRHRLETINGVTNPETMEKIYILCHTFGSDHYSNTINVCSLYELNEYRTKEALTNG